MHTLWQDVRYAARVLAAHPGFTLVATLTLALGIGANSTVFSWVNGTILDPLPGVENSGELIALTQQTSEGRDISFSYPNYLDYRDRNTVLESFTVQSISPVSLSHAGQAERLWIELVAPDFFKVLRAKMAVGRTFMPSEVEVAGRDAVMVISYSLWQRSFGGTPEIEGTVVNVNQHPYTIIGVAAKEFQGSWLGLTFDAWLPVTMVEQVQSGPTPLDKRGWGWLQSKARLKPGVTLDQAQVAMDLIAAQLSEEYPDVNDGKGIALYPLWKNPHGAQSIFSPVMIILMIVAGFVLLIACANVANLLLARASARRKEIAVRVAIGASRARLVRQLLTESIVLALMGGAIGVLTAYWTSGLLDRLVPPTPYPLGMEFTVDGTVLLFSLGVTVLTGLIFGLAPAWQASRAELVTALNNESGRSSGGREKGFLRSLLVVAQVSLSLLLLVSAGLFIRSLRAAQNFDPGFDPGHVFLATFDLFPGGYTAEDSQTFFRELLERAAAHPGVESAALATDVPLGFGGGSDTSFRVDGYEPGPKERVWAHYWYVSPGYFDTMRIPLMKGREFTIQDTNETQDVVLVNETLANRYWKGEDPVGKQMHFSRSSATVVGVFGDIKIRQLGEKPATLMLFPILQSDTTDATLHVRTSGDPSNLAEAVQRAVRGLDSGVPIFSLTTLEAHIRAASFQQSMAVSFLGVLGLIALALASIGLYGVLSFAVGQRTHEIGIRIALGAGPRSILRLILGQGAKLLLIGTVLGLAGAFGLAQVMAGLLFGVSPYDPLTYVGTVAVLGLVSLLACLVPARRASNVDPMVALRYE